MGILISVLVCHLKMLFFCLLIPHVKAHRICIISCIIQGRANVIPVQLPGGPAELSELSPQLLIFVTSHLEAESTHLPLLHANILPSVVQLPVRIHHVDEKKRITDTC